MIILLRGFAGGNGLDEFREAMLSDNRLCIPGVGLKGGVCSFC